MVFILVLDILLDGTDYFYLRLIYSIFYKKSKGALNPGRIAGIAICYLSTFAAIGAFAWKYLQI